MGRSTERESRQSTNANHQIRFRRAPLAPRDGHKIVEKHEIMVIVDEIEYLGTKGPEIPTTERSQCVWVDRYKTGILINQLAMDGVSIRKPNNSIFVMEKSKPVSLNQKSSYRATTVCSLKAHLKLCSFSDV